MILTWLGNNFHFSVSFVYLVMLYEVKFVLMPTWQIVKYIGTFWSQMLLIILFSSKLCIIYAHTHTIYTYAYILYMHVYKHMCTCLLAYILVQINRPSFHFLYIICNKKILEDNIYWNIIPWINWFPCFKKVWFW